MTLEIVRVVFRYLHFIGIGAVLGGLIVQMSGGEREVTPLVTYGAALQLLTGVVLVLVTLQTADHIKVTVKFVLLVVLFGAIMIQRKKGELTSFGYTLDLSLVFIILGVAVFWRSYAV